ncbi:hypothetical protein [Ascidiimonas sp. W6]|uniref:hypothetical protein n=1 Tax=Ascidiimonas meishanensis TaxID=3128903 RepID=UPI0030EF8C3A
MKTINRNSDQNQVANATVLSNTKKRTMMLTTLMMLAAMPIFAVTGKITGWKNDVKTALDAAVLIFAIVGAFLIFIQYMQGNEQAQKNLIRYVIGLAVFGLAELMVVVFI